MKELTIRQQVKSNFQNMGFSEAMEANKELKAEYIRFCGQRSWNSIVAAYERKAKQNTPKQTEQSIDKVAPVEQPVAEQAPEVSDGKEMVSEPFTFDTSATVGRFNNETILSLVESKEPILNQFCIVREYFKQESDTETVRNTRMFVKESGEGWPLYDEASAIAKSKGLKSGRKLGFFTNSNDGFPVGEEYCQITVMRIKAALERFVIGREGVTRVNVAESIENV